MLVLLPALAAPPLTGRPTPFGWMPEREIRAMCGADRVFVGTLATSVTSSHPAPWFGTRRSLFPVTSEVTWAVQRDVRGEGPFGWVLPGGTLDGVVSTTDHSPAPRVGARSALAFRRRGDGWVLAGWRPVPPDAVLPSETALRDAFEATCDAVRCASSCGTGPPCPDCAERSRSDPSTDPADTISSDCICPTDLSAGCPPPVPCSSPELSTGYGASSTTSQPDISP